MGQLYRSGFETFRIPDHPKVWSLSKGAFYLLAYLYQTLSIEKRTPLAFDLPSYIGRTGLGTKSATAACSELLHANLLDDQERVSLLDPVGAEPFQYPKPDIAFEFTTFRAPFGFTNTFAPSTFKVIAHIYRVIDKQNFYQSDAEIGESIGLSTAQVARELRWLREQAFIFSKMLTRECLRDGRCSPQLREKFAYPNVQRVRKITLPEPIKLIESLPEQDYRQRTELQIVLDYFRERDSRAFQDGAVHRILSALNVEVCKDGEVLTCNVGDMTGGGNVTRRVYANSGYWFHDLDTNNSRRWSVSKQTLVPVRDQKEGDFMSLLQWLEPDADKLIAALKQTALEQCECIGNRAVAGEG